MREEIHHRDAESTEVHEGEEGDLTAKDAKGAKGIWARVLAFGGANLCSYALSWSPLAVIGLLILIPVFFYPSLPWVKQEPQLSFWKRWLIPSAAIAGLMLGLYGLSIILVPILTVDYHNTILEITALLLWVIGGTQVLYLAIAEAVKSYNYKKHSPKISVLSVPLW